MRDGFRYRACHGIRIIEPKRNPRSSAFHPPHNGSVWPGHAGGRISCKKGDPIVFELLFPAVVGRKGSVRLMSGSDGALLAEVLEPEHGDDLGEEIAAIGDLNGDGISEVLAGAPGGGYALVISFGPVAQLQITLDFETGQPVISWPTGLTIGILERSVDLLTWEQVVEIEEVEESRYPIANEIDGREQYFRIRFGE